MKVTSFVSVASLALCALAADMSVDLNATIGGKCSQPAERKEWRQLSREEKKAFVDAVKCLQRPPKYGKATSSIVPTGYTPGIPAYNNSTSTFDDIVYAHIDTNIKDHFTALFLPWHRWYVHTFHETLKKQCGYQGVMPYWNWSLDVANITASPLFDSDPEAGLGTFGTPLTDGAFKDAYRSYPTPHVISRTYDPYPFKQDAAVFPFSFTHRDLSAPTVLDPKNIDSIVNGSKGNFTDFAYKLDGAKAQGPHNAAHMMLPGDISDPLWSPNDPLFFLHHANIDRIWWRWQNAHKENMKAFGGGLTQDLANYDTYPVGAPPAAKKSDELHTAGLTRPVKVSEVLDTTDKYLCYVYV
ncbi:tyrosinase tyrosinase: common central domain protein [Rhizoctonia solani 123E]|uniref:Tyrosinase tyrosinase: common central domain protein n=1 Tax=Rhizoctonia solani 123E TaxID=1423351 RepID=A0A074RXR6_9AGAM|nr:tyrosinase tyrosinase: common central domain protein [Rhizoctonia solani 123E]